MGRGSCERIIIGARGMLRTDEVVEHVLGIFVERILVRWCVDEFAVLL